MAEALVSLSLPKLGPGRWARIAERSGLRPKKHSRAARGEARAHKRHSQAGALSTFAARAALSPCQPLGQAP